MKSGHLYFKCRMNKNQWVKCCSVNAMSSRCWALLKKYKGIDMIAPPGLRSWCYRILHKWSRTRRKNDRPYRGLGTYGYGKTMIIYVHLKQISFKRQMHPKANGFTLLQSNRSPTGWKIRKTAPCGEGVGAGGSDWTTWLCSKRAKLLVLTIQPSTTVICTPTTSLFPSTLHKDPTAMGVYCAVKTRSSWITTRTPCCIVFYLLSLFVGWWDNPSS